MSKIRRVLTRGVSFLRTHGLGATYRAALRRLRPSSPAGDAGGGKVLPFRFAYESINYRHGSCPAAIFSRALTERDANHDVRAGPHPARNLYCVFSAEVLFLASSANTTKSVT
jgi:hypothetical protein